MANNTPTHYSQNKKFEGTSNYGLKVALNSNILGTYFRE